MTDSAIANNRNTACVIYSASGRPEEGSEGPSCLREQTTYAAWPLSWDLYWVLEVHDVVNVTFCL